MSAPTVRELLAERFPPPALVEQELAMPVPAIPFRRGGEGMTRLEVLLLRVRSGRAA